MNGETVELQAAGAGAQEGEEQTIRLDFDDFRSFLKSLSANLSPDGMFIETSEPAVAGSPIAFEISLGDDHPLMRGHGSVAWARDADGSAEPAGIAIRFLEMDSKSERLVGRIVEERTKAGLGLFELDREAGPAKDSAPTETEREAIAAVPEPGPAASAAAGTTESLRAELEEVKRQLEEERERSRRELAAAREAEADLSSRLSDSLARVMAAGEARDAIADQLRTIEEAQREDRQRLGAVEEERAQLQQRIDEQNSELNRWTEEAVSATTGREALEKQKKALEEEIEAERDKTRELVLEVETLRNGSDESAATAKASLAEATVANEALETELLEARATIERLEEQNEAAASTEEALRESLEKARAELEEERGRIDATAGKSEELEREVEGLRSEIAETRGQAEAFQAETASIRAEMERFKSRYEEMASELAEKSKIATRAEKLAERVRTEHLTLQNDLVEAQAALDEVAELKQRLESELEQAEPEVFTPPQPASEKLEEAAELEADKPASSLKARLAGLVGNLRGTRSDAEDNPFAAASDVPEADPPA